MSLETCTFCGKPFKRLKSHLPHCKMSPGSKTSKAINKPKEIQSTSLKQTDNKDKTNEVNTKNSGSNLTSQVKSKSRKDKMAKVDKDKKRIQNIAFSLTSTVSEGASTEKSEGASTEKSEGASTEKSEVASTEKSEVASTEKSEVASTEKMNTDSLKPKSKWLAKREKEMLKQDKLRTQTRIKSASVSQQKKNYSETFEAPIKDAHVLEKEIASGQKQLMGRYLAPQLSTHGNCSASEPLQKVPRHTDCQVNQLIPTCKENADVSVQIQNIPKPLTKDYTLGSRLKDQGVSVFQTKTCVWGHIQYGLHRNRYDVAVLFPIVTSHKGSFTEFVNSSESVLKSHRENEVKVSPEQFPALQCSVQRPVEDMLSSQCQNMSVLPYSPDMATGYGGTFSIPSHSETSNKNALPKCQNSKPSPLSQGLMTEMRLGDVRLNELVSWLVARTPKSTREAVSVFNKGWQWYYRRYSDVQKGGIGGIAMLIGVLSYIWSYPHIKKDRWRKYH